MNFVAELKDPELSASLHFGESEEWKWIGKDEIANIQAKVDAKWVLRDAFACVEQSTSDDA